MKKLTKPIILRGILTPAFLFLFSCVLTAQSVKVDSASTQSRAQVETVTIIVNTQPSGATFTVNGQYRGKTPYTGEFRTGDYVIGFTKNGYRPYSETIHIDASRSRISVPLELIPASESTTRIITFRSSSRSGAKLSRDHTYFGAAYEVGHLTSVYAYLGAYLGNLNLEAGYLMPKGAPETDSYDSPYGYVYNLKGVVPVFIGYGWTIGDFARITPRVGASLNLIKGANGYIDQRSYVLCGRFDARIAFSPIRRICISCTPGYDVPVWKDKYAVELDSSESSAVLDKWTKGFSVKFGLEYFF